MKKRILAFIMILLLCPTLFGCGKTDLPAAQTDGDTNGTNETAKTDVDETKSLAVEIEQEEETGYPNGKVTLDLADHEYISCAACADGRIYVACKHTDESGYLTGSRICRVSTDGTLSDYLTIDGDVSVTRITPSDDGSIWYLAERQIWTVPGDPMSISFESQLHHVSAEGAERCSVSSDTFGAQGVGSLLSAPNGGLFIASDSGVTSLDASGTRIGTASIERGFLAQSFLLDDGTLMAWHWIDLENNDGELLRLDADSMTFEPVPGVEVFPSGNIIGGAFNRLWTQNSQGDFVLYDPMTQEAATAIHWADLDIDRYGVSSVCLLDENTVVLTALRDRNSFDITADLYVIRSGYSLNTEDKITLTMAGIGISDTLRKLATEFNKANDAYYVEITDYLDYDTLDEDSELSERFLYEISTGELPDILVFSDTYDGISVDALARKGYLTDLGARIDADPALDRSDFLENILDAADIDGTLYTIPIDYMILTAAAATQITGGGTGCTLDDLKGWIAANPDYGVMGATDKERALLYLLQANAHSFIGDDGSAALDADMLRELLDFMGSLPDTWSDYDSIFSGESILMPIEMSVADESFLVGLSLGQADYSLIGIPCVDGNGQVIRPYRELAIASDTAYPDGCWEFIRYALSADFQNIIATGQASVWQLPLRKDALETAEAYTAQKFGFDAPNPAFDTLIRSVSKVYRANSLEAGIIDIIQEEAELAFSGQKTLDSAVSSIQSRASIYIAERD